MKKGFSGTNPKDFVDKKFLFEITSIEQVEKISKAGNPYKDWTLGLKGLEGEYMDQDLNILFLFERDFNNLIDSFGEDETTWIGKNIYASARKDGEYLRWDLVEGIKTEDVS